ncbi:MAG: hypothetical protein ABW185_12160, partial [Sedimenticola sp.]
NLKLQRAKKRRYSDDTNEAGGSGGKVTRSSSVAPGAETGNSCFFCGTGPESGDLRKASMFRLHRRVKQCAELLGDSLLLAKLSAGDMMAQDAIYHVKCLSLLYRKAERCKADDITDNRDARIHGIVLAELVTYIEDSRAECYDMPLVLKLADLAKMYTSRLNQLGVDATGKVQTTRLKHRLLDQFPDMEAHKHGRDVLLAFNEGIGLALKTAYDNDFDDDGIILAKAARIVRKDMFSKTHSVFTGSFEGKCQQQSVPASLTTLVNMILGGPDIKTQSSNVCEAQAALTLAQLLHFNSTIRRRDGSSASYHTKSRETPLPIYTGLLVHAETRKRGLIDKLYDLGLSISYDRVLEISTDMGNRVCEQFERESLVCPVSLRKGIFTTSAVDNIDHNPTSTTSQGALHGTGISIFQHPTPECIGEDREISALNSTDSRRSKGISPLPESYTSVPPVILRDKEPVVPAMHASIDRECPMLLANVKQQYKWLEHAKLVCEEEGTGNEQNMTVSWAAYHASETDVPNTDAPVDISTLLPLFQEQSKSPAMIRHAMDIIQHAVDFLNPGQIPVIACDQPLYALAKTIQWNWPETHGEDRCVIMFGGLHIEMTALKALGNWLQDSGWVAAIADANIASSGTADSFIKAAHVTRTRHAHQVTAASLYILMQTAFQHYLTDFTDEEDPMPFDEWRASRGSKSHQFLYWSMTLDFE